MKSLLALLLISTAAFCFAGNLSFESSLTVSPTNTVGYYDTHSEANRWLNLNSLYVMAPASKTGTVSVAALRGGSYVTVATVAVSNSTASVYGAFSGTINIPVCGVIRITANQTGTSTNDWKYGLFFEDGK